MPLDNEKVINKSTPETSIEIANEIMKENLANKSKRVEYGTPNGKFGDPDNINTKSSVLNVLDDITMKLVYMKVFPLPSTDTYIRLNNTFMSDPIKEGGKAEYDEGYFTNWGRYDRDFVPTMDVLDSGTFASMVATFDEAGAIAGTSENSLAWRKQITWKLPDIQFLGTSELQMNAVLNSLQSTLGTGHDAKLYNKVALTAINAPTVNITSTAADAYLAWIEIKKHVSDMVKGSDQFNIDNTKLKNGAKFRTVNEKDIVVLVSNKVYENLSSLKSQLIDAKKWMVEDDNIFGGLHVFGQQIDVKDEYNTIIKTKVGADKLPLYYLADNEIVFIERDVIKIHPIFKHSGTQQWDRNAQYVQTIHIWYMINVIPWKSGFKFTCDGLKVIPSYLK